MDRTWALTLIVAAVAAAWIGGSLAAIDSSDQYGALEQPGWAPPGWLFGPVWTGLYIAIAAAGFLIWRASGWGTDARIWAVQLGVNGLWTPLFFALEWRLVALGWILALNGLVAWLVVRQWPRWPARLLLPYLAWIGFATALDASVWWLNR